MARVTGRGTFTQKRRADASTMLSPKIIALEEGWNNEIKAKAIDVLASA